MNNIDTRDTIKACRNWLSKYGLPNQIVTDNGTQFAANAFQLFCKENGIRNILTAPYHKSRKSFTSINAQITNIYYFCSVK